ncbi:MAG: hypothetical protein K2X49_11085 [Acetobacteraceae bacterium]|nr:hypothetical protein [Acetobacteraceae bacterium]
MADRGLADYGFAGDIDEAAAREAVARASALLGAIMPLLRERAPETLEVAEEVLRLVAALTTALASAQPG